MIWVLSTRWNISGAVSFSKRRFQQIVSRLTLPLILLIRLTAMMQVSLVRNTRSDVLWTEYVLFSVRCCWSQYGYKYVSICLNLRSLNIWSKRLVSYSTMKICLPRRKSELRFSKVLMLSIHFMHFKAQTASLFFPWNSWLNVILTYLKMIWNSINVIRKRKHLNFSTEPSR